jgi:hypothetical protein
VRSLAKEGAPKPDSTLALVPSSSMVQGIANVPRSPPDSAPLSAPSSELPAPAFVTAGSTLFELLVAGDSRPGLPLALPVPSQADIGLKSLVAPLGVLACPVATASPLVSHSAAGVSSPPPPQPLHPHVPACHTTPEPPSDLWAAIVGSPTLPLPVMDLQFVAIGSTSTPHAALDAQVVVVGSSPFAVVMELRATTGFPGPPPVAEELLATDVEESTSVEVLTPDLQLDIAAELLHHFDMAEKNNSMSMEELDLIEFLVTQVASLSSSLLWRWHARLSLLSC